MYKSRFSLWGFPRSRKQHTDLQEAAVIWDDREKAGKQTVSL